MSKRQTIPLAVADTLKEALRRWCKIQAEEAASGKRFRSGITSAWTGLGYPREYEAAVEGCFMSPVTCHTPRVRGFYRLEERGASIVQHWMFLGFDEKSVEQDEALPVPNLPQKGMVSLRRQMRLRLDDPNAIRSPVVERQVRKLAALGMYRLSQPQPWVLDVAFADHVTPDAQDLVHQAFEELASLPGVKVLPIEAESTDEQKEAAAPLAEKEPPVVRRVGRPMRALRLRRVRW